MICWFFFLHPELIKPIKISSEIVQRKVKKNGITISCRVKMLKEKMISISYHVTWSKNNDKKYAWAINYQICLGFLENIFTQILIFFLKLKITKIFVFLEKIKFKMRNNLCYIYCGLKANLKSIAFIYSIKTNDGVNCKNKT